MSWDASDWLIAYDRGMNRQERREFERWLAEDPRNTELWTEAQRAWQRLDRVPEVAEAARRPAAARRLSRMGWAAAAALLLATGVALWRRPSAPMPAPPPDLVQVTPRQLILPDGSRVELNLGAEVLPRYTPAERRVRLARGEALFTVKKNAARPFIVEAGKVSVRAVGTAFNVRLDAGAVEVLVTEGRVRLDGGPSPVFVAAGQRAMIPLNAPVAAGELVAMSPDEIDRSLAWRHPRLDFKDLPLAQVAAEFNAHSRTRLVVEPSAAHILIAGTFQADNVDVFVRFLTAGFHVDAERRNDGTVVLRRSR